MSKGYDGDLQETEGAVDGCLQLPVVMQISGDSQLTAMYPLSHLSNTNAIKPGCDEREEDGP